MDNLAKRAARIIEGQDGDEAIRGVAREICKLRGQNPDIRIREWGQSSYDYWAWELFTDEARQAIADCSVPIKRAGLMSKGE